MFVSLHDTCREPQNHPSPHATSSSCLPNKVNIRRCQQLLLWQKCCNSGVAKVLGSVASARKQLPRQMPSTYLYHRCSRSSCAGREVIKMTQRCYKSLGSMASARKQFPRQMPSTYLYRCCSCSSCARREVIKITQGTLAYAYVLAHKVFMLFVCESA